MPNQNREEEDESPEKDDGIFGPQLHQYEITLELIERLKRGQVCLFPGELADQPGGIADFTDSLHLLGQCNALIFCVPGRKEEDIRNLVLNKHGGVFHGVRVSIISPTQETLYGSLVHNNALFPKFRPEWVPPDRGPSDESHWGVYAQAEIEVGGERRPLDLLHLGIGRQSVWLDFLQPHGIKVARIIMNPPYERDL
jgi:hypothetical protein